MVFIKDAEKDVLLIVIHATLRLREYRSQFNKCKKKQEELTAEPRHNDHHYATSG